MIHVFVLRLAPLFAGEAAEEFVDVSVGACFVEAVKFADER